MAEPGGVTRRDFLLLTAGLGSVVAVGAATLPNLPALVQARQHALPAWATTTTQSTRAYHTALDQPDLLTSLPCFCGCATYQPPHRNLYDCFVNADGTLDTHAAGCTTCQEEALAAGRWADQGLSAPAIRTQLVASFGDRGPSTDSANG